MIRCSEKKRDVYPRICLKQTKEKHGLKCNSGLALIDLRTTRSNCPNVCFFFPLSQPRGPVFPPLYPPSVDSALVSNDMEYELRSLVTDHRRVRPLKAVKLPRLLVKK